MTFVIVVLTGLLPTLLVNGSSLLDARIMRFELETGVCREVEYLLHGLAKVANGILVRWIEKSCGGSKIWSNIPDLEHATAVGPGPDTQDVLAIAHAQDSTTYVLSGIAELVADEGKQQILPVPIRHTLL